jgi:hypothetical protein
VVGALARVAQVAATLLREPGNLHVA